MVRLAHVAPRFIAIEQSRPEFGALQGLERDAGARPATPILDITDRKRRLIAAWSGVQRGDRPVAWTATRVCES